MLYTFTINVFSFDRSVLSRIDSLMTENDITECEAINYGIRLGIFNLSYNDLFDFVLISLCDEHK